jgi:LysR family glycine cleavage system transcriptional activator
MTQTKQPPGKPERFISHQIRTLEKYLDVRLFDRLPRAIVLTQAGEALRPDVEDCFRKIEGAVRQVRSLKTRSAIVISVGPAIAAKWLVPRLYQFEECYPDPDYNPNS